ncbi:MAG: c-type cytochrome [Paracoccaceae bacterium]
MIKYGISLIICMAATTVEAAHELDGRNIKNGQILYVEQCAACHGLNLEGQSNWRTPNADGVLPAPPHDETGHTWHHDNALLFDYTKFGGAQALAARGVTGFSSGMPAFSEVISDDEIWDILAYLQSTWPQWIQDIQRGQNPPH